MHAKDKLAEELEKIGLTEMAAKARIGCYHDSSHLPMSEMQLSFDLIEAITVGNKEAAELRKRHLAGEFDASREEQNE